MEASFPPPKAHSAVWHIIGCLLCSQHTALLFSVTGKSVSVSKSARTLFETTAQRVSSINWDGDLLQSVSQQGAGLINVFYTVYATMVVLPGELVLNDTALFLVLLVWWWGKWSLGKAWRCTGPDSWLQAFCLPQLLEIIADGTVDHVVEDKRHGEERFRKGGQGVDRGYWHYLVVTLSRLQSDFCFFPFSESVIICKTVGEHQTDFFHQMQAT